MPVELPRRPHTGSGPPRWALPVAAGLVLVVILAAGMAGTSDFRGPRVHLSAGHPTRLRMPRGPTVTQPTAPLRSAGSSSGSWLVIVFIVVGALLVIALLWRLWDLRRTPSVSRRDALGSAGLSELTPVAPDPEPEPEALLSGLEVALTALDESRDPGDAVVRAWLGLQATAEESGIIRGPSETPTEFTSRILGQAFADDGAIRTLLRLYLRTRFGDHPVSDAEVAEVRSALESLVASWRGPAVGSGGQ